MKKNYHRKSVRYSSNLPLLLSLDCDAEPMPHHLTNVSEGGIAFHSERAIRSGSEIAINFAQNIIGSPINARVVWCQHSNQGYLIGVEFTDQDSAFRTRMVQQICHIERYRRKIASDEGRHLSSEEAAMEWISHYAADFPQ